MNPKIYLIHASEDKDRFVTQFAKNLMSKGVDVWLDKWEMSLGDSLIDKMFEEGIKNAQAFIVVLSQISVKKKWVKEELNASLVKRINTGSKIIPVIIEDCEIPEALKNTLWVKINNLTSYKKELDEIVSSIFGVTNKPELGSTPKYTSSVLDIIPGLTKLDSIVFNLSCVEAVEIGDLWVHPHNLIPRLKELDMTEEQFFESLEVLDEELYIRAQRAAGGIIMIFEITTFGFDQYVQKMGNYSEMIEKIISAIINEKLNSNSDITSETQIDKIIVNHVLNVLEQKNLIKQTKAMGGLSIIHNISPQLKRMLKG